MRTHSCERGAFVQSEGRRQMQTVCRGAIVVAAFLLVACQSNVQWASMADIRSSLGDAVHLRVVKSQKSQSTPTS